MSDASQEKTGPSATIDIEGLRRFIRERGLGAADDLRAENISFGHSNEVHRIRFEGKSWALRRPPRGPLLPTAHDVIREYRVLKALQESSVPIPRVYAACDDPGYIGAPFYLMQYMTGEVIRADGKPKSITTEEHRRAVSEAMIDILVKLQAVDWRAVGLEGFGRPDGYLARQLKRWVDQLERTTPHTRPLPPMARVKEWLGAHLPESQPATIVHGDFKLDNVMWRLDGGGVPRAVALFDWEMSTIGDPLADLGWMLTYWPAGTREIPAVTSDEPGYLTRPEMTALYESRSGRAMRHFAFYEVLALFKLAIILEGSYARFIHGQADDPLFAGLEQRVPALADAAWSICTSARG
ncbi:MAG: phosphotransferase family protein [Candidatus Binataceae bacterium]